MVIFYEKDTNGSMIWVRDKDGRKYSCYTCDLRGECNIKSKLERKEELSEQEKIRCMDVSNFIGETRP